ncbi:MAG: hypothetical protein QME73_06110 [Bacillota bacterium]|nr:hypothetical protein [Bacillota bacterium]
MASQTTIGRTKKGGDFIAKAARVLLVIVLLLSMSVSAFAAPNQPYRQSHAASYNERRPINVEINGYAADMADYLIDAWYSEITALDGGRVEVFGYTQCNRICDEVRVKLTLQ